ncbi:hypothetical protein I3843_07G147000 [Carya illinoinensis]|nr:hypothetical protein I3843_07G147000 [Carya illinoinensis]
MPMKINYDRMCNVSYGSWLDSGQKMVTRGGCWLCPFQWLGERMIMKKQKKVSIVARVSYFVSYFIKLTELREILISFLQSCSNLLFGYCFQGSDHKDINITTRWLEGLFNKDITINDEVYSVQSVGIRIMLHI